jgi:hypothetical protein
MGDQIKVLTLHQPYASLIALEVKRWETRSRPAPKALIGERIAIHAAARQPYNPNVDYDPDDPAMRVGDFLLDWGYDDNHHVAISGSGLDFYGFLLREDMEFGGRRWHPLPLGAIVCTARLAASLPMVEDPDDVPDPIALVEVGPSRLLLWPEGAVEDGDEIDISDQRAFGDWRPGRWAWLLEDVVPVEPYPFRGGQGWSKQIDAALLAPERTS